MSEIKSPEQLAEEFYQACEFLGRVPDAIREAFLAGYAAAQRWIPVGEALPEKGEWVLTWAQGYRVPYCALYLGHWVENRITGKLEPSHWQHIPTPPAPKEEK